MESPKSFAEIWKQAHCERSRYYLSFILRILPDVNERSRAKSTSDLSAFGLPIGLGLIALGVSIAIFRH